MVKNLPSYNDGAVFVFEKVMKKLDIHLAEQKILEDRYKYQLKKSEDDNEVLENRLTSRNNEIAKLNRQLKHRQVGIHLQKIAL